MKQKIIILLSIVFLSGCSPFNSDTGLPEGWLPVKDKIKSYFPVNENDVITYISENNETLSFICYEYSYYHHPYSQKGKGQQRGIHHEECSCSAEFECTSNSNINLGYHMSIEINRTRLITGYGSNINGAYGGSLYKKFENDYQKDKGLGYPMYPNEVLEYLTDTIELRQQDTDKLTGILVSDVGLAWFTDGDGVKWYLQEVSK